MAYYICEGSTKTCEFFKCRLALRHSHKNLELVLDAHEKGYCSMAVKDVECIKWRKTIKVTTE